MGNRTVEENIMCFFKGNLLTVLVLLLIERLILILIWYCTFSVQRY
jgi:hypothetical protein